MKYLVLEHLYRLENVTLSANKVKIFFSSPILISFFFQIVDSSTVQCPFVNMELSQHLETAVQRANQVKFLDIHFDIGVGIPELFSIA